MSAGLSIVRPVPLTDARLFSTNVPENDHAAWVVDDTYALGVRAIVVATHRVYESLQAGNVGRAPATNPTWWIDVGPTNRWRAFDTSNATQTAQATSIVYTLRPGIALDSLAALNLTNATSVRVQMTDPTFGAVYDKTVSLVGLPGASGWWSWFFGVRSSPTQALFTDLPSYPGADVTVTISGGAGLAVGVILFGQSRSFSMGIKYGARVGIQDYSRKERNSFGDTILVKRAYARRANFDLLLLRAEVDSFIEFLASARSDPCLWIGSNQDESLTVYGFYKNFDVLISYPMHADCSLEIEGLT